MWKWWREITTQPYNLPSAAPWSPLCCAARAAAEHPFCTAWEDVLEVWTLYYMCCVWGTPTDLHVISCLKRSRNAAECEKLQNLSEKQKHSIKPCVLKSLKSWQLWLKSRRGYALLGQHTPYFYFPLSYLPLCYSPWGQSPWRVSRW